MQILNAMKTSTLAIGCFAVFCAGLIAITQVSTVATIAANERAFQAKALYELVPKASIDNDLLEDRFPVQAEALGHAAGAPSEQLFGYRARKGQQVVTVILPVVATDGYSGNIHMIVAIHANGVVAGVRVLKHKETPGLGDKIELKKSNWILSFEHKRKQGLSDPHWAVKKDGGEFDQFTGATITPRAVVNAVGRAVDYFVANRSALLQLVAKPSQAAQPQTQGVLD